MATRKKSDAPEDALPDKAEVRERLDHILAFAARRDCARVRGFLESLAGRPPQVILLEGGTAGLRLAAALYWSLLVNCRNVGGQDLPGAGKEPCYACDLCRAMASRLHRDLFFLDGLAGSIKIDEVRAILPVLGEPPRVARQRIIILAEAQSLVEAAANTLLKSMEEPRGNTTFILLAPQRERLLPTLVSRSFALTLPWLSTDGAEEEEDRTVAWEAALCTFLDTGGKWFDLTGARGALDAALAQQILGMCRKALARRIVALQSGERPRQGLDQRLARLSAARLRIFDEILTECQDGLQYNVGPAVVLDWMATRLFSLIPRTGN